MRRPNPRPELGGEHSPDAKWFRRVVGGTVAAEILFASLFIGLYDYDNRESAPDDGPSWTIGVAEKVRKFKLLGQQNALVTIRICNETEKFVELLEKVPTAEGYKATIEAVESCPGQQGYALLEDLKEVPDPGRVILLNDAVGAHNIMYDACATKTIESKGPISGCHE